MLMMNTVSGLEIVVINDRNCGVYRKRIEKRYAVRIKSTQYRNHIFDDNDIL